MNGIKEVDDFYRQKHIEAQEVCDNEFAVLAVQKKLFLNSPLAQILLARYLRLQSHSG